MSRSSKPSTSRSRSDRLRPVDAVRVVSGVHGRRQVVRQLDDTTLEWVADVAGKEKRWKAKITEQEPDQRIAWTATEGAQNGGVVTFHRSRKARPG